MQPPLMIIMIREQIRELGTRESEVQRIFAGLRQAVSSKVYFDQNELLQKNLIDDNGHFVSLQRFLIRMSFF